MSLEPIRSFVPCCVRNRNRIAPRPPSRPAAAARIRNCVLGSRQKKRPRIAGREGASGELILHLRTGGPRPPRPHPTRRRRTRASSRCRRTCCPPCASRTRRRPTCGRSGTGAKRRETPLCTSRSGRKDPPCQKYRPACRLCYDPPFSGGVAQLVRARGSYPLGPGFKSLHRHQLFALPSIQVGLLDQGVRMDSRSTVFSSFLYFPVFTSIPPSLPSTATRCRTMPLYRSLSLSALSVILASSSGSLRG